MAATREGAPRPTLHVDLAALAAAEANPDAGLYLDLSGPLEAALADGARAEAAEAPARSALLRLRLSDETRKERRNLLSASVVGLAVGWAGLAPQEATVLGVQFDVESAGRLVWLLIGGVSYFLAAFCAYALSDAAAARAQGYLTLAERRRTGTTVPSAQEQAEGVLLRLAQVIVRGRADRQLRKRIDWWASVSSGLGFFVAVFDVVLPLGLAVWAIVELAGAL